MKTKITAFVAGLLLAVGASVALPAAPAAADNFDTASGYVCAAHRPANTVLFHSWPVSMGNGVVEYWCRAGVIYGQNWQYYATWYQSSGTTARTSGYQLCYPNPGWIVHCGTAGH